MTRPLDMTRVGDFAPQVLRQADVVVVGCGTTGSWVAHDLLRLGFCNIRVVDYDNVESHNVPAQFHSADHVGVPKVEAFKAAMKRLKMPVPKQIVKARYPIPQNMTKHHKWARVTEDSYMWSCVDSVDGRRDIAEAARLAGVRQLIDLRMGPESGTILATGVNGPMPWDDYMASLDVEFAPEPACGRRAYVTTAKVLTGLAVHHWIAAEGSWLNNLEAQRLGIESGRVTRLRPRTRIDLRGLMIVDES
jgi:threonine dehydrogenase-like Zn-dependent dehydrogenase